MCATQQAPQTTLRAKKDLRTLSSTFSSSLTSHDLKAKAWIDYLADHVSGGSHSKPIVAVPQSEAPVWIGGQGKDNSPTVDIDLRFAGIPGVDESQAARKVITSILNSKFADIRQGHAISYGMSARYVNQVAGGYWKITGSVDASRAAQAGHLIRATLDSIRSGTSAYKTAFVLARRKRVDALLASALNSQLVASRLEFIARFDLPESFYDTLLRKIAALTPEAVEEILAVELQASNQVTGAFGPKAAVQKFLDATKESTVAHPLLSPGW